MVQLPLNDVQLSLLRMFDRNMTDEQTLKIKRALVRILSDELEVEVEKAVQKKNITDKDFDALRKQNYRNKQQ